MYQALCSLALLVLIVFFFEDSDGVAATRDKSASGSEAELGDMGQARRKSHMLAYQVSRLLCFDQLR